MHTGSSITTEARHQGQSKRRKRGGACAKSATTSSGGLVPASPEGCTEKQQTTRKHHIELGASQAVTIEQGPAKGWYIMAYFQDIRTHKTRSYDSTIRWRVCSPGRSRTFIRFRSNKAASSLQDSVTHAVYHQIFTEVKPDLMKHMYEERIKNEGCTPKSKCQACDLDNSGGKHQALVTPRKWKRSPIKAKPLKNMQEEDSPSDLLWGCDCQAHLRRHPRCCATDCRQPMVVHLADHMLIGRAENCDLVLDSIRTPQMISRYHAVLQRQGNVFTLVDKGSLNGLLVNGKKIHESHVLAARDVITFGVPTENPEMDYIFEVRPPSSTNYIPLRDA